MRSQWIALTATAVLACCTAPVVKARVPVVSAESVKADREQSPSTTRQVSGTGVHYFKTSIIHSQEVTPTGMIQTSTDTVELTGGLTGRILYHPTSVVDFTSNTVVNTGHQVFSGTVLGSPPVMMHDDEFRFELDLATSAVHGEVHLRDHIAGPKVRCDLSVTGNGDTTPEGNGIVEYAGTCTFQK